MRGRGGKTAVFRSETRVHMMKMVVVVIRIQVEEGEMRKLFFTLKIISVGKSDGLQLTSKTHVDPRLYLGQYFPAPTTGKGDEAS